MAIVSTKRRSARSGRRRRRTDDAGRSSRGWGTFGSVPPGRSAWNSSQKSAGAVADIAASSRPKEGGKKPLPCDWSGAKAEPRRGRIWRRWRKIPWQGNDLPSVARAVPHWTARSPADASSTQSAPRGDQAVVDRDGFIDERALAPFVRLVRHVRVTRPHDHRRHVAECRRQHRSIGEVRRRLDDGCAATNVVADVEHLPHPG